MLGITDLVTAVTLGVLYSDSPAGVLHDTVDTDLMATLPISLIPTFGVPVTLVAHILSLANLAARQTPAGGPTGGSGEHRPPSPQPGAAAAGAPRSPVSTA